MAIFKTGLKISLISSLLLVGSITTTARADHDSHSILPFVAMGVFAAILNQNSHSRRYTTTRRYSYSTRYGQNDYKGHDDRGGYRYQHNQHSHSAGGYYHKRKHH